MRREETHTLTLIVEGDTTRLSGDSAMFLIVTRTRLRHLTLVPAPWSIASLVTTSSRL
jgi:hypothetical protein